VIDDLSLKYKTYDDVLQNPLYKDFEKPLTFQGLMKTISEDIVLQAIVQERERMLAAWTRSLSPWPMYGTGYAITCIQFPDPKTTLMPVPPPDDGAADAANYQRDPFWQQWREHQAQAESWKTPVFMSESEMDWEDDEEITEPGMAPTPAPSEYKLEVPTDLGPYPRVTTDGIMKTDRCYLCATKNYVARFERSPGDWSIYCVGCLYSHVGWELLPSGELRKVPGDV
jgi:hypothetical protein